ncbi:hypothetical protein HK098_004944 [Nowakowskiella sp. JEL0407]|nr:hypothetical protein HK098_004944 [Nowakowskiella sp. JEL0407]
MYLSGRKLEVCIDSVESAIISEQNGASRVELCDNLVEGGTTPSAGAIALAKKKVKIPVHVMIRPRGGDFLYSDVEFEVMKLDVETAKSLKADGVVFGILTSDGRVDIKRTKDLVEIAKPMSVTFHRAFDMTRDPFQALEDIIEIGGIQRILTSGQEPTVLEGTELIMKLIELANDRIIILPGGGITSRNIKRILDELPGLGEIHAALPGNQSSEMKFRNGVVYMGVAIKTPEYLLTTTDGNDVEEVVKIIGS